MHPRISSHIGMATLAAVLGFLIAPHRRRFEDVGHDWRSLLIGAPPALR